jgi:flagellar hook-basal body complex protein FliE
MADPISGSAFRLPAAALPQTTGPAEGTAAGGPSFADTLKEALGDVSQMQTDAHNTIDAFLTGQPVELHDVMAATEEASLSLELLVEVRNKLADAYRSIMNMQG